MTTPTITTCATWNCDGTGKLPLCRLCPASATYWRDTPSTPNPIEGTGLVDRICADYANLVAAFGTPGPPYDKHKSRVGWVLDLPGIGVATIYDYGDTVRGLPPIERNTNWHVGGHSRAVLAPILDRLHAVNNPDFADAGESFAPTPPATPPRREHTPNHVGCCYREES